MTYSDTATLQGQDYCTKDERKTHYAVYTYGEVKLSWGKKQGRTGRSGGPSAMVERGNRTTEDDQVAAVDRSRKRNRGGSQTRVERVTPR